MKREKICYLINNWKTIRKGLIFLVANTIKDITNLLLKLEKVFLQKPLSQFPLFFLGVQFYKKKACNFGKKIKYKLRTKTGLLFHRT